MSRGKASGINLYMKDAQIVVGMQVRGDRNHDIAAWFGVNQGRIAEVKGGKFGELQAAPAAELPPSGPPGLKGRRIRGAVRTALQIIENGDGDVLAKVTAQLRTAAARFDTNE
jgi:hypothetical protein